MTADERQFLLTAAWMFMRHGQPARAQAVCEALLDEDSRDGEHRRAIDVMHGADIPQSLAHAEAVLETRALKALGRKGEASSRWNRYLESRKGSDRKWM